MAAALLRCREEPPPPKRGRCGSRAEAGRGGTVRGGGGGRGSPGLRAPCPAQGPGPGGPRGSGGADQVSPSSAIPQGEGPGRAHSTFPCVKPECPFCRDRSPPLCVGTSFPLTAHGAAQVALALLASSAPPPCTPAPCTPCLERDHGDSTGSHQPAPGTQHTPPHTHVCVYIYIYIVCTYNLKNE